MKECNDSVSFDFADSFDFVELQISNQIRFVLINSFQYMFLHIQWQIVLIDKFSLPDQVLPQELPRKKGFDRDFKKRISLKLNRQIVNFINGGTNKK